ncbi:hypothetical protein [Brachybacterium hainanense]|uniref:Phage portal protein n=1 Tax=Brachybacterium hainanense TaxID=1541174 RepID=A0ABV6R979_9MICO
MGILSRILGPRTTHDPMTEFLAEEVESLRSLAREDRGWSHLGSDDDLGPTREALVEAAKSGRALAVAHPLVRRGLSLRTSYVHGNGGPQLSVADEDSSQDVAKVVLDWWTARENEAALTGPEARARLERSLSTDGNVFLASFTNPRTGAMTVRTIPFEQITAIHTDPEDRMKVWFFERTYTRRTEAFSTATETITVLHPELTYAPSLRPKAIRGNPVLWDQPIRHVKVNDLDGWQYGIGDTYAIAPYARGYRDFLNDWLRLMRSLSQFAWQATAEGNRAKRARQALARVPANTAPGNEGGAGSTYVSAPGEKLEAIPKTGATIDADSGRPILAMIAAGLDVPVTMLSTDPGVTGARATAETLDEPMYLAMAARRDVWTAVYRDLAEAAIEAAVRAPQGPLQGTIERDPWTNTDRAILGGATPSILVDWPDLSTATVDQAVAAIKDADSTGKLPPKVIARLLLTALGVDDIDDILEELTDDEGNWRDPYKTAGDALVSAFNRGEDPAQALGQYARFPRDAAAAESLIRGES